MGLPDTELTTARAVVEQEPEDDPVVVVEPPTPLELFLADNPASPLRLLPPDEAAKYMPTRENLVEWIGTVDEFADVDAETIEYGEADL